MKYLIQPQDESAPENDGSDGIGTHGIAWHARQVDEADARYLRQAFSQLQPLSEEQFLTGPAVCFYSAAKFSYVLDGANLFCCIEWPPGLVVLRIVSDAEIEWVSVRSPVPDFGGRTPLPEDGDPDDFDEDNNPQYNLIYLPWDAQFDQEDREADGFAPADADVVVSVETLTRRMNALVAEFEHRCQNAPEEYPVLAEKNLANWAEPGLRLNVDAE